MPTTPTSGPALTPVQRTAIERTDRSLALTSGAGCGKTFVLARRYLRALEDDGTPEAPLRVVAVTFTEKAALEMRQRVGALLAQRMAAEPDATRRGRLHEWLARLPEARISTIHGFCSALLRREAIDAGVDPGFTVLADAFQVEQKVHAACTEAALGALGERSGAAAGDAIPAERLVELLDHVPYAQMLEMLQTLVDERWRWRAADYADPDATLARWDAQRRQACARAWAALDAEALRREIRDLAGAACEDPADKLAVARAERLPAMEALLDDPDARTAENLALVTGSLGNIGGAKAWGSRDAATDVRRRLAALGKAFADLAPFSRPLNAQDALAGRLLSTLTALADDAVRRYALAKRRLGVLDFVDLLVGARDLLAGRAPLRRRVAQDIRHLLIDEFQDTDSLQRELLWLALDCRAAAPPPGRLFFVGDAKQSIYRFRGAEVEVFQAAREAIARDDRLHLDLNFRTHAAGIALVNRLFSRLMGPAYEPLEAHRAHCPPDACGEILLARCEGDADSDAQLRAAANVMARRIAEMIRDGERRAWDTAANDWRAARAGDIVILLPRLQNTAPFEEALQACGVDYYVVAGAGLYRQQEVFDLVNALLAIDNPLDDVALFGFLRGGMVGLDDNALLHVARAVQPPYRGRLRDPKLAERLAPAALARLRRAADLLDALAARKDALGLDALIERLLEATGFEAVLLAQFQGQRKCGNVHRILDLARSAEQAGSTLREFVSYVSTLTVEEVRAEQAAVESETADVVRLMTIHKAKGLEFPVVFLADLNYAPQSRTQALNVRGPFGLTLRVEPFDVDRGGDDGELRPTSHTLAAELDRRCDTEEDLRAFYVAVTRHRDYLAFVGADVRTTAGEFGKDGCTLRLLDEAIGLEAALQAGEFRDGTVRLVARTVEPVDLRRRHGRSPLDELCTAAGSAEDLAAGLARPRDAAVERALLEELPALPPPAARGTTRLSATSLAELERCPACFHWHHELRVPLEMLAPPPGATGAPSAGAAMPSGVLDAASAGTLFHRCMELLDVHRPQPAEDLVRRALAEMDLSIDPAGLASELATMLARLREHPLWAALTSARRRHAELAFVTRADGLELTGQIDLLLQDAEGHWRVIDYKSDRIPAADVAAHAAQYELQMLIYADAAGRYLRQLGEPADGGVPTSLYFLRAGATHDVPAESMSPAVVRGRLAALAGMLAECRRSGHWPARRHAGCAFCPFAGLCR